ncbi:MAG: hypothetical protein AB7K24_07215 [Gemmataceae bacterium]
MKRKRAVRPASPAHAVTTERAARLYRLLELLDGGPKSRSVLMRRLKLDVRGFYRDLGLLRDCGILLQLEKHRYRLEEKLAHAVLRLPFPDPLLSLGEAVQLAKGRSAAHRKLKEQLARIM